MTKSVAQSLASLPAVERDGLLAGLSTDQLTALKHDWQFWARPAQLAPPGDWSTWLIMAGRGFGKTRSGSQWSQDKAQQMPGSHGALVGMTPADVRDVMVEGGDSSILKIAPPWFTPAYEPSKRRLTWPNGTWATIYSSAEYDKLRGPQHHWAWCDELPAWHYPRETWDMLQMGLRLGEHPQCCITTTPRPIPVLRQILADPSTVTTGGETYENRENLAASWFTQILRKYEGTSLGEQELRARLLDEAAGAMWKRAWIERDRRPYPPREFFLRVVVAIDPATTSDVDSNETGIVTCGLGRDQHGYLLDDVSGIYAPEGWARAAIGQLDQWEVDRVVAETNQGGEMVAQTLRTVRKNISYRGVTASKSKEARAEPVSMLAEQGRLHHCRGFAKLEDELCTWEKGAESPNRLDAFVWAMTDLMLGASAEIVSPGGGERISPWVIP